MSFQTIASESEAPNKLTLSDNGVLRRTEYHQPSAWGDYFLSNLSNILVMNIQEEDSVLKKLEELKEAARSMFVAAEKHSDKLCLIDSIQCLGLSYHFEDEINEILDQIQNSAHVDEEDEEDLYIIALKFRLLRQQGFPVSCEIFNKFTTESGDFKESITKDEKGLLSLYEASHLRMKGESIMDEALEFTTTQLEAMAMDSTSPFSQEAKYALKWPIYKTLSRFMTRHYISLYHNNPTKNDNNILLTFAKLDYNSLQKLYQRELGELSRWWNDSKLKEKLPFARDRVVESYIWALGIYYEPKYSSARTLLAKIIALITLIDDMYDCYGTLEELQLFTNTIGRWDMNCIEELPNYMKVLYEAILKIYEGTIQDMCMDNNIPYAFDYAKEGIIRQCKLYMVEAKWFNEDYVPTIEEYMKVSATSIGLYAVASIAFLSIGNIVSEEIFQWVQGNPMLHKASEVASRLVNDIVSHKFGQERCHVTCSIECYMEQYGVSKEVAIAELKKQVDEARKEIIEDYIKRGKFPRVIHDYGPNFARVTDFYYKERDGFTFANTETKHLIALILTDPMPI
ncbi:putative terpene synthase 2 isoform X1 [Cucumis melo var. makuwa]|nr:putative terpene synthase 2 isoform X1 [Cucumis melo var. makuwa]